MSDLTVPARLRRFFREAATDITLRQIENFWEDEGFTPGPFPGTDSSSRRELWAAYENNVKWEDPEQVRRVLRVYECLLPDTTEPTYLTFLNALQRDGLNVDGNNRISATSVAAPGPRVVAGRYELDSTPIGRGGYGHVFLATDLQSSSESDRSRVAVKLMLPEAMKEVENVRRFEREIRIMTNLSSPYVLPIYDSGFNQEDGWWYTMPVAEGGSLIDLVSQNPSGLPLNQLLAIMRSVCAGVTSMHDAGYIHRDLSPGNVLRINGDWVVCDFGLSVPVERDTTILTRTGVGGGTRAFFSPEQTSGMKDVKEPADVYSLGKLVQYLTEGVWPDFAPALTNPLRGIITKATNLQADKRYVSAKELEQALVDVISIPVASTKSDADLQDEFVAALRQGSLGGDSLRLLEWLKNLDPTDSGVDLYYLNTMPKLYNADIQSMWSADAEGFAQAFGNFCSIALNFESFRFQDVDEPGRFAERAAQTTNSPAIRSHAIELLARLGRDMNRWLLRELAVKLLRGVRSGPMADAVVEGFTQAGPGPTMWTLRDYNLDQLDVVTRNRLKALVARAEANLI